MKKNGQYVGVDEKYIPEEEKYVDESLLGPTSEIRDGIKSGVNKVKEYVSDADNQEKIKKTGRKGLKIAKGIGIGYLVFFCVVVLMAIGIFILVIVNMVQMNNDEKQVRDNMNELTDKIISEQDNINNNRNTTNSNDNTNESKNSFDEQYNQLQEHYNQMYNDMNN